MYDKINQELLFERLNSLNYGTLFKNAAEQMDGNKLFINGAWFIYIIIAILSTSALTMVGLEDISSLVILPIVLPISVGIVMLGVDKVRGKEIRVDSIFNYYIFVWQLFFASILVNILTMLGMIALLLPGIYLMVSYMFVQPLIVDKKLSFWEAMELSRKIVSKRWFFFFGFEIITAVLFMLALIPLGIGLIWALPFFTLSYAILFDYIFSVIDESTETIENL